MSSRGHNQENPLDFGNFGSRSTQKRCVVLIFGYIRGFVALRMKKPATLMAGIIEKGHRVRI